VHTIRFQLGVAIYPFRGNPKRGSYSNSVNSVPVPTFPQQQLSLHVAACLIPAPPIQAKRYDCSGLRGLQLFNHSQGLT